MCGPVLAPSDAVVGPHIDHVSLTQRRQSDARPHVIGKRKEGRGEWQDAAMQGHARGNSGHGVLSNAEMEFRPAYPNGPPTIPWVGGAPSGGVNPGLSKSP